jgi:hypothetical protein
MKTKLTALQRINRVIDFYYKRGVNCERANRIKHKIIFDKFNKKN